MKIVILDAYTTNPGDLSWEPLQELGEVTIYDRTSITDVNEIIANIGDADIVVTNKTPLSKDVFDACPSIKYVTVLATGFDCVDIAAASNHNICVSNVPAYGSETVSQFAIALLLEVCHHIGSHADAVQSGKWERRGDFCFWDYPLIELAGKTAGVFGYGNIGRRTAATLQFLGMHVLVYDPYAQKNNPDANAHFVSKNDLFSASDVIILHCPLTEDTHEIINAESIQLMKDQVIIINNARGGLVNEQALADSLNSGKVQAAALDVVSTEPILPDNPLLTAKNCIITPHISWATKEARARIIDTTVQNIRAFLEGKPGHVVN